MRKVLVLSLLVAAGFLAAYCATPPLVRTLGAQRTVDGLELVYDVAGGFEDAEARDQTLRVLRARCEIDPLGRYGLPRIDGERVIVAIPRTANDDELAAWRTMVESSGELTIRTVADQHTADFEPYGERERLDRWLAGATPLSLAKFNALEPPRGGPAKSIEWFVTPASLREAWKPVVCERATESTLRFTTDDFFRAEAAIDAYGDPDVILEPRPQTVAKLLPFTSARKDRQVALGLGDQVQTAPILNDALGGPFELGRFSSAEARDDWLHTFHSGRLPVELEFVEVRPASGR